MNEEQLKDYEKLLVDYINKKETGTMVSHDDIECLVLLKKKTGSYYTLVKKVADRLLDYNKTLQVVKGKGYKILNADEVIDKALKKAQQGEKRLSEAMRMVNRINPNTLSEEYKLKYDLITVKYQQMNANLVGGIKEVSLLTSPKKDRIRR